jgi:hypothetical protein
MDDVTNYLTNIGKDLSRQKFHIQVTYQELTLIKALAQNPHPNYMMEPDTRRATSKLFEELKEITGYAQRKHYLNSQYKKDTPPDPFIEMD